MRILFVALNYPPETIAAENLVYNLAVKLSDLGHQVSLLIAAPSDPYRDPFAELRSRSGSERADTSLRIIRPWVLPTKRFRLGRRFLSNTSFVISAVIQGARKTGPVDVLIAQSPPLFAGLAGFLVARLRRAKFVLNVSDLWPETLVELGELHNGTAIRLGMWLAGFLYRKADLISAQTRG